jgi:hypothetical protein
MVTEFTGNAIPGPGYDAQSGQILDQELLYSTVGYVQKGVTLKPGQGVLPLGTFLKQDATTKQYVIATTPSEVQGVLRQTTDTGTDTAGRAYLANILYAGILKLSAVTAANSGVTLTSVLSARVNSVEGFFKF